MKAAALALILLTLVPPAAGELRVQQDPCAGCNTDSAVAYQKCAREYGNPCAELNEAGLVIKGAGTKKDVGCCMKKEKHDRCMSCKSMDCQYATCKVNKEYYSEYTNIEAENKRDKEWDKKAMAAAGWGEAHAYGEGDAR